MHKVCVNGLEIFAFHGISEEEKKTGTTFILDIEIECNFTKAAYEDNLKYTIDYSQVCSIAEEQMKITSNVVEHVAQRIVNAIYQRFSDIKKVKIKIQKKNPPLNAKLFSVGVEIEQ
ncbi:MAG: dihydroneopterin aldolase [Bacteroidetes bacterium]|nr:dihydroneopterin aldolase [Bacteroidota bacterium]MBV6462545.1 Dihydroneopterin aldolase [Flavobacteriales bacterium]WKZ75169.1 MAG: dihydroneopterin aldolase [Vicingaceae bacterium]MCL4817377.1 dihydroneopterin aldolase [Flavobacteriales bacterium]NOG96034.1 dihydroneopterin aldolase [Bacteroidota bacterium]